METDYAVVVLPLSEAEGGGFVAHVPDLPGCMSDGETQEEAIANARDAIADWLDANADMGRDTPLPGASVERHRARDKALLEALAAAMDYADHQDGRIAELEAKVRTLITLMASEGPISISDLTVQKVRQSTLPCH